MKLKAITKFHSAIVLLATLLFYVSVFADDREPPVSATETQAAAQTQLPESVNQDPYLWMETIEGLDIDTWIEAENAKTVARLSGDPRFELLKAEFNSIYESDDRLPDFGEQFQYRGYIYQLHTDPGHPRGSVKRVKLTSYASPTPAWETLIDVDAIAAEEKRNWYVRPTGFSFSPSGDRVIVSFSDGGSDAVALREFDLKSNEFVEGGFTTPVRRHMLSWLDEDTLLVATALDDEEKTTSFYPRHVRKWTRGTDLANAKILASVASDDMLAAPSAFVSASRRTPLIFKIKNFSELAPYAVAEDDTLIPLEVPMSVTGAFAGLIGVGSNAVITLEADWTVGDRTFPAGSLVAVDFDRLMAQQGKADGAVSLVYQTAPDESLSAFFGMVAASDAVYFNVLKDVKSRVKRAVQQDDGSWRLTELDLPGDGAVTLPMLSDPYSGQFLLRFENFLIPPSLHLVVDGKSLQQLQEVKAHTDLSKYETEQFFATAEDGTRIPYFVTHARGMPLAGSAPVLMYAYGGFGIPITQSYELPYIGPMHEIWLSRGGVFVVANPRGGGEYGPAWHLAAKRTTRQVVYDDLYAVSEDIIARKISSPGKFGFIGGSNGGLTAGVLPIQRPDLFGASISLVPLLDMARFHKLLAGASWMDEYGNPDDPVEGPALLAYSPYQNIRADGQYPEIFFLTSTRDDRVHPGHARKMAKKMMDMGNPVLFYEAREGGHGMAVNNQGRAFNSAMQTVYLMQKLMD